jgi:diadenosine tetraphosphatase ApaH/serine/threonine PP2A family protein phosphatase
MRIAVINDVHGNLPALRAVLAEIDALDQPIDAVVIGGDVVGGPLVRESLELLAARAEPKWWISGNGERDAVAAFDGQPTTDDQAGRAAAWSAQSLDQGWRDQLASWPIELAVDGVVFCHGSPRSDEEIVTRATPDAILLDALAGARGRLVVGGHTHQQIVREVDGRLAYANAGSVGMPYEGRPGAFWMLVTDGVPELRETAYDVLAAAAELRASGYVDVEDHLGASLLEPVDPDWVTAFFEHTAGRGEDPGEPRMAGG